MDKFLRNLKSNKVGINRNKNPIDMGLFLSFLTVDVIRPVEVLGNEKERTQLIGDNNLIIDGGVIDGVEYIDELRYGKNMQSQYHNYVHPFYLFEIFNPEGKRFFLDYYADDIKLEIHKAQAAYEELELEANDARKYLAGIIKFWDGMNNESN